MKASIKNEDDVTVVELRGYLDYENTRPLTESIEQIYMQNRNAPLVINLEHLEFVGSSGISSFVKSMRVFNRLRMKPTYCGVKSEFVKLFRLFEDKEAFDISETLTQAKSQALTRFVQWQAMTPRSNSSH